MLAVDTSSAINDLRRFFEPLTPKQAGVAVSRSINESLRTGRAQLVKEISTVYTIKPMLIRNQLDTISAKSNNLEGKIRGVSRRHSMSDFKNSGYDVSTHSMTSIATKRDSKKVVKKIVSRPLTGRSMKIKDRKKYIGLNVEIKKGSSKNIQSAFLMQSKGGRIWAARGRYNSSFNWEWRNKRSSKSGSDLPVNKLLTPSVYAAAVNRVVQGSINEKLSKRFLERLEHNLTEGLRHTGSLPVN